MGQPIRYALICPEFRFKAVLALAGRAPIGGEREIALACLQVARLCTGLLPPYALTTEVMVLRAENTRQWLSAVAIPQGMRTVAARILEALAGSDRARVAKGLADLVSAAAVQLDEASRTEMDGLIQELSAPGAAENYSAPPIDVHLQAS